VQERLVQQEADLSRRAAEEHHQQSIGREKVLTRLWEIANLSPEVTRNSISGQVKALSMIVAIEGLTPDHRSKGKQSAEPLPKANIFHPPWFYEANPNAAAEASHDPVPNQGHPESPYSQTAATKSTNPDKKLLESLLATPVNPWEKAPATSYASIFASASGSSDSSFSTPGKFFNGSR
jgi:hypothetical protein